MGKQNPITSSFSLPDGRVITLETGKLATQADGSVMLRMGRLSMFVSYPLPEEIAECGEVDADDDDHAKRDRDFLPLKIHEKTPRNG